MWSNKDSKIKEIDEKYFNKKSLERINVDDIISYNKFLFSNFKDFKNK